MRGRAGEVISALQASPLGQGGEPCTPVPGLATLKSKTRHMHEWKHILFIYNYTCTERDRGSSVSSAAVSQ